MVDRKHPKNYTVHMIGNAHIDPVWLWRLEEGRKVVLDTCRSALDRMKECPGFVFSRSSAATYLWIEQDDPAMFEEIRQRVKEGRWEIVNGWWEQPDCNIPGGESYVRHALYAKEYFRDKFGVEPTVGYNVDTFGHNGTLPQILAKSGFTSYVFFRPSPDEFRAHGSSVEELPQIFWWESADGSRVLASRPPHHYGFGGDFDRMRERILTAWEQTLPGLTDVLCFYGVGDHGGGPTKINIESIERTDADPEAPNAKFSTCTGFFKKLADSAREFPVVPDDLQHHAVGCYTSVSAVKKFNRDCEQRLMAAERFATVAHALCDEPYPAIPLRDAWRDVLFNQFHDVLAGTSIHPAYEDVYTMYGKALEVADTIERQALRAVARNIDTRGYGLAVVVFNSSPWARRDVVTARVECAVPPKLARLMDENGKDQPVQIVGCEGGGDRCTVTLLFVADVPALGYRLYRVALDELAAWYEEPDSRFRLQQVSAYPPAETVAAADSRLSASPTGLSNGIISFSVDPLSGAVTSLNVKGGPELVGGEGLNLVVVDDPSDTWAHGVKRFRDDLGSFCASGRVRVVEVGPARATLEVTSTFGASTLVQRMSIYPGIGRVDVDAEVDFQERHRMLKLSLPTQAGGVTATYEIPYGFIERKPNGDENPGQKWIDVTGTVGRGKAGVTLLNDGKHGFDVLGGEMRMSVLRTPIYAFHDRRKVLAKETYQYPDLGKSRFRYALVPHRADWRTICAPRRGEEFNTPLVAFVEPFHNGSLSKTGGSFLEVGPENVVGTILKRSQDGTMLIVRLYESHGKDDRAVIRLPHWGISAEVSIGHHEIKTLAFDLSRLDAPPVETDLLERVP